MDGITIAFENGVVAVSDSGYHAIPISELGADEGRAVQLIIDALHEFPEASTIHVERRSENYLSLIAHEYDFCRLKIGPKAKWMTLFLSIDVKKLFAYDSRFALNQKASISHWKIPLETIEDIANCQDLITASFSWINKFDHNVPMTRVASVPLGVTSLYKPNGDTYLLTAEEIEFTDDLLSQLNQVGLGERLNVEYMDKGTLNFCIGNGQIGRVKLNGRKWKIQLITSTSCTWKEISTMQEARGHIKEWVMYAKGLRRLALL